MKHFGLMCLMTGTLLAGCGGANVAEHDELSQEFAINDEVVTVSGSRMRQDGAVASAPSPAPPPPGFDESSTPAPDGVQRLIAYSYNYQIETPGTETSGLIDGHREACLAAGADVCQVVNANIYEQGNGVSGSLSLRALPVWIATFRSGLDGQVEAADGRIRHQSQSADDLTASIYDLEARLEAKRTLRTRLTTLLERPGATVEELVQVERELARLQGDIEGSEAQVRAMRGRVDMSSLNLTYSSRIDPVSRSAFDPLGRALRNLAGNFAGGLADVLTFIAGFLPWLIVILPVGWLGSRWIGGLVRRRREAKSKA